jgi:DNA-binding response OmpR family regulator
VKAASVAASAARESEGRETVTTLGAWGLAVAPSTAATASTCGSSIACRGSWDDRRNRGTSGRRASRSGPPSRVRGRAEVGDRVAGLSLGADDYLPKPFAFPELGARVQALGRRSRPAVPPVLARAGIRLDPARHEVFRDGRYVPLSTKEFSVLAELLRAQGGVVSAEQLLEKAWDEHADPFTSAVRIMILKLRRKLGDPPVVETVAGVGYRIP